MSDILDASALLAFLRDEEGAEEVEEILTGEAVCYAHAINLVEVYYDVARSGGAEVARRTITRLLDAGLVVREDMDREFWEAVGQLKANLPRKSIADCCGLALARRLGGAFITADHHELDALEPLGIVPIRFIR